MIGGRDISCAVALAVVAIASPVAAKLPRMSGEVKAFRCNFEGKGFSLSSDAHPMDRLNKPDLILVLKRELTRGAGAMLSKRSEFSTFDDRHRLFGRAKAFSIAGQWPAGMQIKGSLKSGKSATLNLAPSPYAPQMAIANLSSLDGVNHRGTCDVMDLKPIGVRL